MKTVLKNAQLILIIILIGALTVSIITRPESSDDIIEEYRLQEKIDSLNLVIEENEVLRAEYDGNILHFKDSISQLTKQIEKNDIKLSDLQEELQETLDGVGDFTTNDITSYFSTRYQ